MGHLRIPQLENVGFHLRRKQFGEDETAIKRGVWTLEYSVNDETGCGCDVNLDVSEVFHNNRGQQCDEVPYPEKESLGALDIGDKDGSSEQKKTQIKVSGGSHAEVMKGAGSGEALDTTAAGWNVQVDVLGAQDSSKYLKAAVADVGVSEHLTRKETWIIPGGEPEKCHTETRRTKSSVSGNLENSHRVDRRQQVRIRIEAKTKAIEVRRGKLKGSQSGFRENRVGERYGGVLDE